MAFRPFPLVGAAYADSSRPWSAQRSINLILQPSEDEGTRSRAKLVGVPGLAAYCEGMQEAPVRGLHDCEGLRLAVTGDKLYQITPTRIAIPLGTVPGTGRVEMAHNKILNGYEVLVTNDQSSYVFNTRTGDYGQVTDPGFPGSGLRSPFYIDGYLGGVEGQGRFWAHSELRQAREWNTLDRYDAEAQPDKIRLARVRNRSVLVLGDASGQFFRNTGALTGTFQNENGMEFTVGAASRYAAEVVDSNVVWLGNDGLVYTLDGPSPIILSTGPIAEAMAEHDLSTCFTQLWEDGKHKVVYFTFPQGRTYGIDLWTRTWHERKSYGLDRWRVSALCKWGRDWIAGDYSNGRLYRLDWDVQCELDQPLVRRRVTGTIHASENPINVNALRIVADTGRPTKGPGEFPVQPAGPTITGDAPDGYIGQPYSYQYTITEGDAPVVRVTADALPKGLTLSSTGLLSGVLGEIGETRFRVRATDSNGLWDDVPDSVEVGSLWMLLKVQDAATTQTWLSGNPASWPSENALGPIAPSPGFASSAVGGNQALILPNTTGEAVTAQLPAVSGQVFTTGVDISSVLRIRRVENITFLFFNNGTTYRYRVDGESEWVSVTSPAPGQIFDVCRLNNGRWISYVVADSDSRFIFSDQEIPTVWQLGGAHPQAYPSYAIGCDGGVALMLATGTRIYRTSNGVDVETLTGSGGLYPDSRDAKHVGDAIVFCGQEFTVGGGNVIYTRNRGTTVSRTTIQNLNSVERIEAFGSSVVASGVAPVMGMESNVYLSADLAAWEPSTMPFVVTGSSKAIAIRIDP